MKNSRSRGAQLSYPALTAFCRKHEIGKAPAPPAGRYVFERAAEMQHDTSPHYASLGGKKTKVQTASLVLCYSRMIFFQHYPRFTRFECKGFLAEAIAYFGGCAGVCMIDNTHVVVASGTGKDMVPAPEMAAFGERSGFVFKADEVGRCQPLGARRGALQPHRQRLSRRVRVRRLEDFEPTGARDLRAVEREATRASCTRADVSCSRPSSRT